MLPPAVVVRVVIVGAVAKPILSVPVALLVNVPLPLKAVFTVVSQKAARAVVAAVVRSHF